MRRKILNLLECPNYGSNSFELFSTEIFRKNKLLKNIESNLLKDDDDIINGLLINMKNEIVYPIKNGILMLLKFNSFVIIDHLIFIPFSFL